MKKILIIILVFLFIAWIIGLYIFDKKIYKDTNYDIETKTDAIVVLTGGKNRIAVATKLFNSDLAENMFISGVSKNASVDEIMKKNDINSDDKENIELGYNAKNTVENAKEVDNWLKEKEISSIRLVTSNYHMPRSVEEISALNQEVEIVEHPVYSENVPQKWWRNKNSFYFIIMEYNKFLYVYIKNKIFTKRNEK